MPEAPAERSIENGTVFLMILLALIIDGVQALLDVWLIGIVADTSIDIVAALLFGMWFSHYGISVISPKRALGFGGTVIGELIPGLNALPFWTLYIAFTAIKNRKRGISRN